MARRRPFNQFRLVTGAIEETNREFDLVKNAFDDLQGQIDAIAHVTNVTNNAITNVNGGFFDLFLSYGRQDGDGTLALGAGGEGIPDLYLRPNTDKSCMMSYAVSPGSIWEYEVIAPLAGICTLDVFVYNCGLTPLPGMTATLTLSVTRNGVDRVTSSNLDGMINVRDVQSATVAYAVGDRMGIHLATTNFSSGTLMCTAHARGTP